ncbi:cysteine desulfurase [Planctomycetota bacterium]|jgi:cysteine desulfurase|nr:cysteine desulfurase [Planctomycetota bacterium]
MLMSAVNAPNFFLDHNAGSIVDPRVLERFLEVEHRCPGNPSSLHAGGRRARNEVETARQQIATALFVALEDVLFTSGGTESNNLAVRGLGALHLPVLLGEVEHASVREPAEQRGIVTWQLDSNARIAISEPVTPVGLACLVHGQSEVGTIQDVAAAAQLCAKLGIPLHVDAAQSLGRISVRAACAAATSIAFSPHKAGGLRGTGLLVVRHATERLLPLLRGGGQERGLRSGTVSPAHAAATALAIELAILEQPMRAEKMAGARSAFEQTLRSLNPLWVALTPPTSLPNTFLLQVLNVDGRSLLPALDLAGIAISQGSACSSGSPLPPRVLLAMGLSADQARCCIRVSFGPNDDSNFGARAAELFSQVIARVQKKN